MNANNADNTVASLQRQISFLQGELPSVSLFIFDDVIGW